MVTTHPAQTLPSPPGSLNLGLVSQPPALTKYLQALLWSTRHRDYFSTKHTGLWPPLAEVQCLPGRCWQQGVEVGEGFCSPPPGRAQEGPTTPKRELALCPTCSVLCLPRISSGMERNSPREQGGSARPWASLSLASPADHTNFFPSWQEPTPGFKNTVKAGL